MNLLSSALTIAVGLVFSLSLASGNEADETVAFPDLPGAVTSFGAVAADGYVYVYGGHAGEAHHYSETTTLNSFLRIPVDGGSEWETLAPDVRSQGASLVALGGYIYRIGGMAAFNDEGEKDDLRSLDDFARYDIKANRWEALSSLPEPRSSHDSVIVGDKIYVMGGWNLEGGRDTGKWNDSMFVIDLSETKPMWKRLPQPFKRRAIAVAAHDGMIYAIGGMDSENDTSRSVDLFDTNKNIWSEGPQIPNGPMDGFGAAACSIEGGVCFTPYVGTVLVSVEGGWKTVAELSKRRFFHRLVPIRGNRLVAIAGANRTDGHMANLEIVEIE